MIVPAWYEEPISRKHDRKAFDCGEHELNEFLQRYARQSHELAGDKRLRLSTPLIGNRFWGITA